MSTGNNKLTLPRREYCLAGTIFILGCLLRIFYAWHYKFDSDEPQHLHVVWAWTQGLVQYRDVFDNHTPLFHLFFSLFLPLFKEQAIVLYFMRLAMFPFFLLGMTATYFIGRKLFSRRVGLWTVALVSIYPAFLFCSLQFRPDLIWMVCWLAGLALVLGRPLSGSRVFCAGLLFGLALCVSMKTVLLLFSLAVALLLVFLLLKDKQEFLGRKFFIFVLAGLGGLLLVPLFVIFFFAGLQAIPSFLYCTIYHNVVPGMGHWGRIWQLLLFLILLPVIFLIGKSVFSRFGADFISRQRVIVIFTILVYYLSLFSFWPIVTRQNFLPMYSLLAVFAVAGLLSWLVKKGWPAGLLFWLAVLELGLIFVFSAPWRPYQKTTIAKIEEVLELTDPGDWVLDQKGETVFRPRPHYHLFETITRERMDRGLVRDTVIEDLVTKPCYIGTNDFSRFSPDARYFLVHNYVSVGYMRVAGRFLEPAPDNSQLYRMLILIPGEYAITGEKGKVAGLLDNLPYTGARFLNSGQHEFVLDGAPQSLVVFWAQAEARGFRPVFDD